MTDSQTSFWTPARIGAVIGAVLLVVDSVQRTIVDGRDRRKGGIR